MDKQFPWLHSISSQELQNLYKVVLYADYETYIGVKCAASASKGKFIKLLQHTVDYWSEGDYLFSS